MVNHSSSTLDRTFAALSDSTRRGMLAQLARGSSNVTDLARPYAMSLPAASKHLRVLEEAGLVHRAKNGRVHMLRLEAKPLQQAAAWVEEFRTFWNASFDRLEELLAKENHQPPEEP